MIELVGAPNYERLLELLFKFEAEKNGVTVERVVWNGLDADADNHRRYDGERVGNSSGRMAG